MAALDSPYVVRYYDSFIDESKLNIIMGYCDRGDLQSLLRKQKERKPLAEKRIWSLFLQIALGLHYLHANRVLHRDMKSANVFLCSVRAARRRSTPRHSSRGPRRATVSRLATWAWRACSGLTQTLLAPLWGRPTT